MTLDTFRASLGASAPPAGLAPVLRALWHAGRDEWDRAHAIAQDIHTEDGSWVHAYLHRVEGDEGNAAYWYRRARQPIARGPVADEWAAMVSDLLGKTTDSALR